MRASSVDPSPPQALIRIPVEPAQSSAPPPPTGTQPSRGRSQDLIELVLLLLVTLLDGVLALIALVQQLKLSGSSWPLQRTAIEQLPALNASWPSLQIRQPNQQVC